ncbi:MAG: restriction endonuclease subunit S [Desulfobacteraceae bacterium]
MSKLHEKLEVERKGRDVLEMLFQSLLHNLMTGQIRVYDVDLPIPQEAA